MPDLLTVRRRVLSTAAAAVSVGFGEIAFGQQADIAPTAVVSGSDRRWTSNVGLKVIVRDVDQPDASIPDVRVAIERASVQSARPLFAMSDSAGVATLVAPDSGDYVVRILRIGYSQARFRVRLEVKCQQILEAYLARGVGIDERPVVHLPVPPPLRTLTPAAGPRICLDCNARPIGPGSEPAFIIKDARSRVLAMIAPGDTAYRRDPGYPLQLIEPDMISTIDAVPEGVVASTLGPGFGNGLIIITLTSAGAEAWEQRTHRRATPP